MNSPVGKDRADSLADHLLKLIGEEVRADLGIGAAAVDVLALVTGQRRQQPFGKGPEKSFDRGLVGRGQRPGRLDRDAQPLADAQQVIGQVVPTGPRGVRLSAGVAARGDRKELPMVDAGRAVPSTGQQEACA